MQRLSSVFQPLSSDESPAGRITQNDACKYGHRRILTPHLGPRGLKARTPYRSSLSPGVSGPQDNPDQAASSSPVPPLSVAGQYSHLHGRRRLHRGHVGRFPSLRSPRPLARYGGFGSRSSKLQSPASDQSPKSVSPSHAVRVKRKAELQLIVEHARARKELKRAPLTPRRQSSPSLNNRPLLPPRVSSSRTSKANSTRSSSDSSQSYNSAVSSLSSVQSFASTEDQRNGIHFGRGASRSNFGIGFLNVGNTCFLDASLQVLIHMQSVGHYLERHARRDCLRKRLVKPGTSAENECLVCSLKDLYAARCERGTSARELLAQQQDEGAHIQETLITPADFVNTADERYLGRRFKPHKLEQWKRRRQQDVHEYLMAWDGLLVTLQSHLQNNGRTDFTKKLFSGTWQTTTMCAVDGCSKVSRVTEPVSDVFQVQIQMDASAGHLELDGLIKDYFKEETLDADNLYYCEDCQRKVKAVRSFRISQAPRVLLIHLKRFSFTLAGTDPEGEKIPNSVRLSQTISLSKYLAGSQPMPADYSLSGVLCHHGKNVKSGHYTSYVRGGEGRASWAHFDDLNEKCPVRICDAKEVLKGRDSYVLFYESMNRKK